MNRAQCKGCAYFRSGDGYRGRGRYLFCNYYLDTGIRRKVGENEKCLCKSKVKRKLCKPFEVPPAQC